MAWRFVEQPNGKLARFSEVVDDFTDYDLTEDEALQLAQQEHSLSRYEAIAKIKVSQGDISRFFAALYTISIIHGRDEAIERFRLLTGLDLSEVPTE